MSRGVLVGSGLTVACLLAGGPSWATTETPSAVVAQASTPSSSMTVRPGAGTAAPIVSAQNGIAGPLQGPLASPGLGGGCCPCRPVVHHVRHRVRVARRPAPEPVALVRPLVPYVPLVPYRPVYVYRPLVPVYAYRPYFFRPFVYGRFFGPRFY